MSKKYATLINFLLLTLSGTINAFAVTCFLSPVNIIDGGFSGTSILLSKVTTLPIGLFLVVVNFPFYVLAYKKLGLKYVISSLFTIVVYAIMSTVFVEFFTITDASPIAGKEMFLCAVFGGLLSGVGSGLTIRFGATLDGVEVLAVIFAKKLSLSVGTFVMIYNVVMYVVAGIVLGGSGLSWAIPLYSIIAYAVGIKAVDFIVEGFDKAKAAMIVTTIPDAVAEVCSKTFSAGVTVFNAKGYYSGENKGVLYVVVNRFQIPMLKKAVLATDETAFITITEISDVMGTRVKKGIAEQRMEEKSIEEQRAKKRATNINKSTKK